MINLKETKNKIFKKENSYFLVVLLFIFSIDRYSKIKIVENFSDNVFFLNEYLNFDLVWNTGIGFGLLDLEANFFYHAISFLIFIIILVIFFILIMCKNIEMFYYSMILGGALQKGEVEKGLANSAVYLDMMGKMVVAWLWIEMADKAIDRFGASDASAEDDQKFLAGKLQAAQYFMRWELPKIKHQAGLLQGFDETCMTMQSDWF